MAMTRLAAVLVASVLALAGCSDDEPRSEPAPPTPDQVAPQWQADQSVGSTADEDLAGIVVAGDRVVLAGSGVAAVDRSSGKVLWEAAQLDDKVLCASSPTAASGIVVFLTGRREPCQHVVAVDTATGRTAWTAKLPAALDGVRNPKLSVGPTSVVVTGYCAGFARFDAGTGALNSVKKGQPWCDSASASDGTAVVTSHGPRLARYDASTGRRTARARVPGVVRVGEVVSSDPLVVTALVDSDSAVGKGCALVDWSAAKPVLFGLREPPQPATFGAVYGCEVTAAALVEDHLWLDDGASVTGQDLATHEPTRPLASRDARLLGATGQRLVLADPVDGSSTHLVLGLPDDPSARHDLGVLVGSDKEPIAPAFREPRPTGAVVGDVALVILRDAVVAYPITSESPDKEQS